MKDKLPNFLIVGAAKGGTTSIYYYLQQSNEVFFPTVKEPCFLAYDNSNLPIKYPKDTIVNYVDYLSLFKSEADYKCIGEASAIYLYFYESTIENIKKYLKEKDIKIVMTLRNPVDRAFSQYMMNIRDLRENLSFEDAISAEKKRREDNWNSDYFYLSRGFYYKQVRAYIDAFGRENVKIFLFEDLIKTPQNVMDDLFSFLEISRQVIDTKNKYNVSGRPKYKLVNKLILSDSLLKKSIKWILPDRFRNHSFEKIKNMIYKKNLKKETLSKKNKTKMVEIFREDISSLSKLINRDLNHWL